MRAPLRNRFVLRGTNANPQAQINPNQMQQLQASLNALQASFGANAPAANYADAFFAYVASFGTLTALQTAQINLVIQSDSDFEWLKTAFYSTQSTSENTPLQASIQITDSGNGQQIFSNPVPFQAIAGTMGLPFVNPVSRLFVANSTIQLVASNFDAATEIDNLTFVLLGRKIWKFSN